MKRKKRLSTVISMRLSPEDMAALDKVRASIPVIPRLALARIAMRLGLSQIEQHPARVLAAAREKA